MVLEHLKKEGVKMNKYITAMIENAKVKKTYLEQLLSLTKEQSIAIKNKDMIKLDNLYQKKGDFIKIVDRLDDAFLEQFESLKLSENIKSLDMLDSKKYNEIKDLKIVIESMNSIIESIFLLEQENKALLEKHINEIKYRIKQNKNGQRAKTAYGQQQTAQGHIFVNQKK